MNSIIDYKNRVDNKIESQKDFFSQLKKFIMHSSKKNITEKAIYSFLINYGISQESKDKKSILTQRFSEKKLLKPLIETTAANIRIKNDFYYLFKGNIDIEKAIKIYISLDADHLEEGALLIYDYLDEMGIDYISSIRGSSTTTDNIIIRVNNIEEAKKISEFIRNNHFIQEGLNIPNPFLFTDENGVTYAFDGRYTTINKEIAKYLYEYINTKKIEGALEEPEIKVDEISREGFYTYLEEEDEIISSKEPNETETTSILKLIRISENPNLTIDIFNKQLQARKTIIKQNLDEEKILEFTLRILSNKYGYEKAKEHLKKYLKTGNINCFSKDHNSREVIRSYMTPERAKRIIEKYDGIDNYLEKIRIVKEVSKLSYIINAIIKNYKKYGEEKTIKALQEIDKNGNYNCITRENNTRNILIENVKKEELLPILYKYLIDKNIIESSEVIEADTIIKEFVRYIAEEHINYDKQKKIS